MFEVSTTESFANPIELAAARRAAGERFRGQAAADRSRLRPGHLLPHDRSPTSDINALSEPIVGRFTTAPASPPQHPLRLVGRHRRPGLGHRRQGHGDLRHDRRASAGFLPAFRRHDLCRRSARVRSRPDGRHQVGQQGRDRREDEGRRDARRISRPVEIQHDGRASAARSTPCARPSSSGTITRCSTTGRASKDLTADDRYTEKSVPLLTARAARAFHEMTPIRYHAGRARPRLSQDRLRAAARRLLPRPALLSRRRTATRVETELTPNRASSATSRCAGSSASWPIRSATWKVIASDMPIGIIVWNDFARQEGRRGHRQRPARVPASGRELEIADLLRFIKNAAHRQHGLADRRRALHRGPLLQPGQGGLPGFRAVLGVRFGPAACRHLRPGRRST